MTHTYRCIRWNKHPLHTEAEVEAALRTLTDVASPEVWSTLINLTLTSNHSSSSWAHWACRVVQHCSTADEMSMVVAATASIVKNKLSGPTRRDAPPMWYRVVYRMVDNPLFGTPGQKKRVRHEVGHVVGNGSCIKTFRPIKYAHPQGVGY